MEPGWLASERVITWCPTKMTFQRVRFVLRVAANEGSRLASKFRDGDTLPDATGAPLGGFYHRDPAGSSMPGLESKSREFPTNILDRVN
jgi:hypothetical protein